MQLLITLSILTMSDLFVTPVLQTLCRLINDLLTQYALTGWVYILYDLSVFVMFFCLRI